MKPIQIEALCAPRPAVPISVLLLATLSTLRVPLAMAQGAPSGGVKFSV